MKIGQPSVTSFGTQVIVQLMNAPKEVSRKVTTGHKEYPRFSAMAKVVARRAEVNGVFVSADIKVWPGTTEVQLSWKHA